MLRGSCERIVVAGHSMGGLLALLLAAEKSGRDTGLAGVISMAAPIYIAEERGIAQLPPRELCRGKFVPKARRRLRNLGSAQKRLVWLKSSGHLIPLGEERDIVFSESAAFIGALAGGGAEADR